MSYFPIRSEIAQTLKAPRRANASLSSKSLSKTAGSRRTARSKPARNERVTAAEDASNPWPIIVHCHLCWDWVWQRPQQFISRLSQRHKILFVETFSPDPQLVAPLARFRIAENLPNVTVLRLQFEGWRWNDGDYVDNQRRELVQQYLSGPGAGQFDGAVQWFYDPMAVTSFAGQMDEILTVYDCMDELSKFRGAPPEIVEREAQLLAQADVMFTGGRKLFESKSRFHDNCHFYGCGVDWKHFGKARLPETELRSELSNLRKPVLGYFGVVDERMDYELLARLADANPDWSVAMVGPVLKVEEHTLPQRPNLHWLGQQAYADLPAFCKGFDVCLMPFALNESTEFINPTKALEYMATGRPIVSTAVADVVRNFGEVVKIAANGEEFISLCRQAIEQSDTAGIKRGLQMACDNSWEAIVAKLEEHVNAALSSSGWPKRPVPKETFPRGTPINHFKAKPVVRTGNQ